MALHRSVPDTACLCQYRTLLISTMYGIRQYRTLHAYISTGHCIAQRYGIGQSRTLHSACVGCYLGSHQRRLAYHPPYAELQPGIGTSYISFERFIANA
eukprot:3894528-Rhodomonas_salina.2